jgi:rod shape-determining protein MreD
VTIYLVVPLLAFVGLLQATAVPRIAIRGVFPDLPLLVIVSWSLLRGSREGLVWGFVAGIMVDLLSGAPFGAATLPLMAVGFLSGLGAANVFRNALWPLVTVFLATIVYDLLFLLVVQVSGDRVEWLESLVRIILPCALLNALLTPLVLGGMRALYRRFKREEVGL